MQKLRLNFDTQFKLLSEFSSGHICTISTGHRPFHPDGTNLQMQTYFGPQIMHNNSCCKLTTVVLQQNKLYGIAPSANVKSS